MITPITFYTQEKLTHQKDLEATNKKLFFISALRLLVFIVSVAGAYVFYENNTVLSMIIFIGFLLFCMLVFKSKNLQRIKAILTEKIAINTTEIDVLHGRYSNLKDGEEFQHSDHSFSHDIDLFGPNSFFQYSNRTATQEGAAAYATLLTKNCHQFVLERQEAVKELASQALWRQHFSAIARLTKPRHNVHQIVSYLKSYTSVLPKFPMFLLQLFSICSVCFIVLTSFEIVPPSIVLGWFLIGLLFTATQLKKTQKIYTNSSIAKETFKQYFQLLKLIEDHSFDSKLLKEKKVEMTSGDEQPSVIFQKFSKTLDAFDQRNNILISLLGNGFFLWDILNATKVEYWIENYNEVVEKWFDGIAFFDAQNTLGNFSFNHPGYFFPTLTKEPSLIQATQLAHPLLNQQKRVANDFSIHKEEFFVITGANMAGKSTFLRTISLAVVMANSGLPVCAKEFEYVPVKLITSMRTSDSLAEDESYFYSELKRLKFIVDQIHQEPYFIILDEILKGTNSKDKAIGSWKFIEKLHQSTSAGIIATHDVSLCDLEKEYDQIHNYYFDAFIQADELSFDYTLKKGICKNMNASFLLRKMKIV